MPRAVDSMLTPAVLLIVMLSKAVADEPPMLNASVPPKIRLLPVRFSVPSLLRSPPRLCLNDPAVNAAPAPIVRSPFTMIEVSATAVAVPEMDSRESTVMTTPGRVLVPDPLSRRVP